MSFSKRAALVRKILKEEGFSDIAIAGAMGRLRAESQLDPKALRKNDAGPGKHSRGILQWNRKRLSGLEDFAAERGKSRDDLETQVRYFAAEVKGKNNEGKWGQKLLNAKTPREAARAAISLARPKYWKANNPEAGHGFTQQLKWTNEFAGKKGMDSLGSSGSDVIASVREDPWMGTNNPAGKSKGRMDEEGEAFTADAPLKGIPQLDALAELLFSAEQQKQEEDLPDPSEPGSGLDDSMDADSELDPMDYGKGLAVGLAKMFSSIFGGGDSEAPSHSMAAAARKKPIQGLVDVSSLVGRIKPR